MSAIAQGALGAARIPSTRPGGIATTFWAQGARPPTPTLVMPPGPITVIGAMPSSWVGSAPAPAPGPPVAAMPPTPAPAPVAEPGGGASGIAVRQGPPAPVPIAPIPPLPEDPMIEPTADDHALRNTLLLGGAAVVAIWLFRRRP